MRSAAFPLAFVLSAGACTQIIGLGDYENVDDPGASGSGGAAGGANAKGGASADGGRSGANTGGDAGAAAGAGGAAGGEPSVGGSGPTGGSGPVGGAGGEGASIGPGGAGGAGGQGAGGTAGAGGDAGSLSGGTTNGGSAGKGTGGSAPTGGTSGGTAGKGGSGGSSGAGGKGTGGCVSTELLVDANFDAPTNGWDEYSQEGGVAITESGSFPTGIAPHSGTYAAWLGGSVGPDGGPYVVDEESYVQQLVTLPVAVTALTLTCYYQIATEEVGSTVYDTLTAALVDSTGTEVTTFWTWDNNDDVSGWQLFTRSVPATSAAGRSLYLRFHALQDDLDETSFFLDTCSLRRTCN